MKPSPGTDEPCQVKTQALLDLLGKPAFYLQCPEYFFMRDQALPIIARWKEGGFQFPGQVLQLPLETFIRHTLAMQEAFGDHGPESVIRFFQKALGSPGDHFVVYYKRGQQEAQELLFHPEQGGSDGNPRNHTESVRPIPPVRREPR